MLENDPLWYRDAIIYELHVRAFCDSVGDGVGDFRGLTEKLDPEAIVGIINAYLGVQANAVAEHKGYVDKFIGDKAMAVWGATAPQADHALRAVRCAWDIQQAVKRLNADRERQGQMITTIAIGINTGPMVAGNMGSEEVKTDYTVIGDTVNTSARFMTSAQGGQIMIGESTYELVKGHVRVAELPPLMVKGKTEPLKVYEVTGLAAGSTAPRPGEPGAAAV